MKREKECENIVGMVSSPTICHKCRQALISGSDYLVYQVFRPNKTLFFHRNCPPSAESILTQLNSEKE